MDPLNNSRRSGHSGEIKIVKEFRDDEHVEDTLQRAVKKLMPRRFTVRTKMNRQRHLEACKEFIRTH